MCEVCVKTKNVPLEIALQLVAGAMTHKDVDHDHLSKLLDTLLGTNGDRVSEDPEQAKEWEDSYRNNK